MKLNLNDTVRVQLTGVGRAILADKHRNYWGGRRPYVPVPEDEHGYSRHQLWGLMDDFGHHVGLCMPNPMNLDILVPDEGEVKMLRDLLGETLVALDTAVRALEGSGLTDKVAHALKCVYPVRGKVRESL